MHFLNQATNKNWLWYLAFAEDIFSQMNEPNTTLQEKYQCARDIYANVRASQSKRVLFSRQISYKSCAHFPAKYEEMQQGSGGHARRIPSPVLWFEND